MRNGGDVNDNKTQGSTPIEIATRLLMKLRFRLNQWQKEYAKAMGWKLRGRGRPKKAMP
jgi:hypothetical protein